MNQKLFPQLPNDKETLVMLQQLREVGTQMIGNKSQIVNKAGVILAGLSMMPEVDDFGYFLVHQECSKDYTALGEWYNPIIRKGQDYALSQLNKEIGDMNDYFNSFQFAMYHISERAKRDESFAPINVILWSFYMSLYSRKKFENFVDRIFKLMEERAKTLINSRLN